MFCLSFVTFHKNDIEFKFVIFSILVQEFYTKFVIPYTKTHSIMKPLIVFFIVISCTLNLLAQQQNTEHDKDLDKCLKNKEEYQGKEECYQGFEIKWKDEIDHYKQLFAKEFFLDTKELLEKSQKEWEKYKKGEIQFLENFYKDMDGSFYDMMHAKAKMNIYRARALQLKTVYESVHQP